MEASFVSAGDTASQFAASSFNHDAMAFHSFSHPKPNLAGVSILVDPVMEGPFDFGIPYLYQADKLRLKELRVCFIAFLVRRFSKLASGPSPTCQSECLQNLHSKRYSKCNQIMLSLQT